MAVDRKLLVSNIVCTAGSGLFVFWLLGGFGRKPADDTKPVAKKGRHVIAIVDVKSPTIRRAIILDSPIFDALKLAGMYTQVDINEPFLKEQGYDGLLAKAGGADALAILDDDGNDAYCAKLPTDQRAIDAIISKFVINPPAPLAHAPPPIVESRGGDLQLFQAGGEVFVQDGGERRRLSAFPTDRKLFAQLPSYGASNPVFPESEWPDIDRRNLFGSADWIYDQDGHGSCVANAWCNAYRKTRLLAGMKDMKFGPGYTYAKINGGKDQGAVISDGINALIKFGACPFDVVGQDPIYESKMPKAAREAAAPYKLQDAYRCDSWEELGSAIAAGYLPVFGVMVGNNFGHFDAYGVCGRDPGPGNHALHADGMVKLKDDPKHRRVLHVPNSWRADWGPFRDGSCYLTKDHLYGQGVMPDTCVLRLPARNPNDGNKPPKYAHKGITAEFIANAGNN